MTAVDWRGLVQWSQQWHTTLTHHITPSHPTPQHTTTPHPTPPTAHLTSSHHTLHPSAHAVNLDVLGRWSNFRHSQLGSAVSMYGVLISRPRRLYDLLYPLEKASASGIRYQKSYLIWETNSQRLPLRDPAQRKHRQIKVIKVNSD